MIAQDRRIGPLLRGASAVAHRGVEPTKARRPAPTEPSSLAPPVAQALKFFQFRW